MDYYVIYKYPKDYPASFVVRPYHVQGDGSVLTEPIHHLYESLEDARKAIPPGLVCINRHDYDDPVIAETWI